MKTFKHNKFATVAVAMLGVVFFVAGAHAQETNSLTVRYSDLNLNSAAGAKVLYQRIRTAAKQLCGDVDDRQLGRAAVAKACLDQTIENSVRAVNNMQLTRVANEHGHILRRDVTIASAR
jgi:UrcA family protein